MRARPDLTPRSVRLRRVLAAACLGGLLGALAVALPAAADDTDIGVAVDPTAKNISLTVGGRDQVLNLVVINNGQAPAHDVVLNVMVPLTSVGVTVPSDNAHCEPNGAVRTCRFPELPGRQRLNVAFLLRPPSQQQDGQANRITQPGSFEISYGDGNDTNTENNHGSFSATLIPKAKGINEVAGAVVDGTTGKGVDGAKVKIVDSAGRHGDTTTDSDGSFLYRPDAQNQFKAGKLTLTVTKDGFSSNTTTVSSPLTGGALEDVRISLTAAAPTESPSAPADPTSAPTSAPVAANAAKTASTGGAGDSSTPLWLIILLTLLTAGILGGGALWVGLRRNKDDDDGGPRPPSLESPTVQIGNQPGYGAQQYSQAGATRMMPGAGPNQPAGATQMMPGAAANQMMPGAAGATQMMPGAAYQGGPYQPASGSGAYQPASGAGYQPASGGYPQGGYGTGGYPPVADQGPYQQGQPQYPPQSQPGYQPPAYPPPPQPGQTYQQGGYDPHRSQNPDAYSSQNPGQYASQGQPDPYSSQSQGYQPPESPTMYRSGPGSFAPEPIDPSRGGPAETAMFGAVPTTAGQDATTLTPPAAQWNGQPDDPQGRWLHAVPPPEDEYPSQGRHSGQ